MFMSPHQKFLEVVEHWLPTTSDVDVENVKPLWAG
jgi:hypothetical protein